MKVTEVAVRFGRKAKVQGRDYEMMEAAVDIVVQVPEGTSVQEHLIPGWEQAKAMVFTELGLAFNTDPVTGRIVEVFPGATPVASAAGAPSALATSGPSVAAPAVAAPAAQVPYQGYGQGAASAGSSMVDPFAAQPTPQPVQGAAHLPPIESLEYWNDKCWHALLSDPSEWWDNRAGKSNPNAPDFKAKDPKKFPAKGQVGAAEPTALWLGGKYPAPDWVQQNIHTIG